MAELTFSQKYRLYPSNEQKQEMERHLDTCRQVYNHFLEQLKEDPYLSRKEQQATLPELKKEEKWPELQGIHSKVLQMVVKNLHDNATSIEEREEVSRHSAVQKLRFKGKGWFKTFTYNQSGYKIKNNQSSIRLDTLYLSKIGNIPLRLHRPVTGEIKQVIMKKTSSGKWFAILTVDQEFNPEPVTGEKNAVGIDLGTLNYAVDSNGRAIGNPRNVEKAEERLAKAQQDLEHKEKGSNNYEKNRIRVAKLHEEVRNRRKDFLHKLSTAYIQSHDIIVVEDLKVSEMVKNSRYAKSNLDASWVTFVQMLTYKAEKAGTETTVVKVDPENTTKNCAECGTEAPKQLWQRNHCCPKCGWTCDRDYNAALNILKKGLKKLDIGKGQAKSTPVDREPLPDEDLRQIPASSVVRRGSKSLFCKKMSPTSSGSRKLRPNRKGT